MSIYIDDLRSMAQSGVPLCDLAADEIESIEEAYELLFKENAKLRQQQVTAPQARELSEEEILHLADTLLGMRFSAISFARAVIAADRAIRLAPDKPMRGKDFWITASQKENNHG